LTIIWRKQRATALSQIRASRRGWPPMPPIAVAVGDVGGRLEGHRDSQVTKHIRVLYCMVGPKGAMTRGPHIVYFFPATAPCPKPV